MSTENYEMIFFRIGLNLVSIETLGYVQIFKNVIAGFVFGSRIYSNFIYVLSSKDEIVPENAFSKLGIVVKEVCFGAAVKIY